jgi:PAS domain S-box-containing protein
MFLGLLNLMVIGRLFAISPRHRWIAGALLLSVIGTRVSGLFLYAGVNICQQHDPMVFVMSFASLIHALALFRFRLFDVVPIARDAVVEWMADGLIVLDADDFIADVNGKAQQVLGIVRQKAVGRRVGEVLHAYPDLLRAVGDLNENKHEIAFGDAGTQWHQILISPLIDRRGFRLGRLVWLRDITQYRRAQTQLLENQRTVAMLKEREMLARELHDGIGQMLAAAHLQASSAREFLIRGDKGMVASCLGRLADVLQETKDAIREYLLGVKTHPNTEQCLITGLRQYLKTYSQTCGIAAQLVAPPELDTERIHFAAEAQLQPIIQEALVNVRKHAQAAAVRVIFALRGSAVEVTVQDDGRGFDPAKIDDERGFGLQSMRGRAESVGGSFELQSTPGKGTKVIVRVPRHKEPT